MKTDNPVNREYAVTVGWLYPELMSTYGDRGNITVIKNRCRWRGITAEILHVDFSTKAEELKRCDLIFGGGAQDRQQAIVSNDLRLNKGPVLKEMFKNGTPGLFVCGSPQLLGRFYFTEDGSQLEGLGIFDMESRHPGKSQARCIGNTVGHIGDRYRLKGLQFENTIVGFENHGGRTYLDKTTEPFAAVVKGYGNNGQDRTEGAVYCNCIATYYHGPFLSKNPHMADYVIAKTLEVKYGKPVQLVPLDDTLEWQAHRQMVKRITGRE